MYRPDHPYDQDASTELLTELLLPVYLSAWTKATVKDHGLRPDTAFRDGADSDEGIVVADAPAPGGGRHRIVGAMGLAHRWLRIVDRARFLRFALQSLAPRPVAERPLTHVSDLEPPPRNGRRDRCRATAAPLKGRERGRCSGGARRAPMTTAVSRRRACGGRVDRVDRVRSGPSYRDFPVLRGLHTELVTGG